MNSNLPQTVPIIVDQLGKQYMRRRKTRIYTLQEAFTRVFWAVERSEQFWAVRNASFSVNRGEMIGIIGRNGAGKSTLLRLLGGIGKPDEGKIKIYGKVGALLDLGAGLNGELTGQENLFLSGIVAGLTRSEVEQVYDRIVAFAELEGSIDSEVRTYSSGMLMRLGFSVIVHTSPDILLVDEALAVGDQNFQEKCFQKIREMQAAGCAIVFVTHDTDQVERLCDSAIWMNNGVIEARGDPAFVVHCYQESLRYSQSENQRRPIDSDIESVKDAILTEPSSSLARIQNIRVLDHNDQNQPEINPGDPLAVEFDCYANPQLSALNFSVSIRRDSDDLICLTASSLLEIRNNQTLKSKDVSSSPVTIHLAFDHLELIGGRYFIDLGVFGSDWSQEYEYKYHSLSLIVTEGDETDGIIETPVRWRISS